MGNKHYCINITKLKNQDFINTIKKYTTENKINLDESILKIINADDNKDIDVHIKDLQNNSVIFIDNIAVLGHSIFYILKRIKKLKDKDVTLHIISNNLMIHLKNNLLFGVLESLFEFETARIKHRTNMAKETRDKKNIKLGRKKGQTKKSKYDKHKRRILYLHKQGVPNTKIVKDINLGTAQSLGKYIKQTKISQKRRVQMKPTRKLTVEDIKNINKLDS